MKKLLLFIAFAGVALANQAAEGFCEQGNIVVTTSGLPSTNTVQGSFPSCTVTVFTTGTSTLATIFSDNLNTPLSNPFTANSSGRWLFYAANGSRLDIQLSGGGLPASWKITDILLNDGVITAVNGTSGVSCSTVSGVVTCSNTGVTQFNTRTGNVVPATNDYTFSQIGGTKQGNTNVPQMAGTNSGANGALHCNDANGNATTSGCTVPAQPFSNLSTGTNTTGPLTVGTGSSIQTTGTGFADFGAGGRTRPFLTGTFASIPATCTVGDKYFATDQAPGTNDFNCTATNIWTQENLNSAALSGNNNFSGTNTFSKINGVFTMDNVKYPCTTAGLQQILADVVSAGGGTADARNCPTIAITAQITIGNAAGVSMSLELPVGGVWTITGITDGTSCGFFQFGETRIRSNGSTNNPFVLHGGLATNNLAAMYCTAATGTPYYNVENVQFYNPNGATMANGAMWVRGGADNSLWQTVTVASYGTVGLNITNICCGATFANLTSNGNHVAGSIPVQVTNASPGLIFHNVSLDHPGSGLPIVKIVGPNSTVAFTGLTYMESNSSDTTTPLIQITDAGSGSTLTAQTILSSPQSVGNTAYIIQNTGTSQIVVQSLQRRGNSSGNNGINEVGGGFNVQTNALNNLSYNSHKFQFGPAQAVTTGEIKYTNPGATIDGRIGAGSFGSGGLGIGTTTSLPVDFYGNGVQTFGIGTDQGLRVLTFYRNLETTAPPGAGGEDRCYADSTSHNIRCNYNNTGFGPLVTAAPCTTSQKTETAADANLLTCAIPAQAGSYRIRIVLEVSAASTATLGWTATWTDSNGVANAPVNLPIQLINSASPALTYTINTPADSYGYADIDVNNAGTSIVVKLTFSGTSFTGKASATVERII